MKNSASCSLVILGAGTAGIACALAAARRGMQVVLLEKSQHVGGTVTQALIHTLGGLFDDQGEFLNPGLSVELCERLQQASPLTCKRRIGKTWVLNADPGIYAQVVTKWLNEQETLSFYTGCEISVLENRNGRVERIAFRHKDKLHTLSVLALIDASGNAAGVRHLDSRLIREGNALAGLILQLRGAVPNILKFPKGVALLQGIRKAAASGELPAECASVWLDSGVYPDEVYIKFNLLSSDYRTHRISEISDCLLTWLRTRDGLTNAFISAEGELGIRDGGCIRGDYCLTEADIHEGRRFPDAVCRATWPIEHWHPQQGVTLNYLPPGHYYTIPLRALVVRGFDNCYVAGKCLCAEPRAQASARVVGTCWAMGEGLVDALLQ